MNNNDITEARGLFKDNLSQIIFDHVAGFGILYYTQFRM